MKAYLGFGQVYFTTLRKKDQPFAAGDFLNFNYLLAEFIISFTLSNSIQRLNIIIANGL